MHFKSMNLFPALLPNLFLLLISFQLSVKIILMEHVSNEYKKLNDYLIKNVDEGGSFEDNLKMAEKLLEEENKSPSFWNKKLRQQLESFVNLKKFDEHDNCDENSFQILSNNNEFTNDRAGNLGAEYKSLRRVDKVVNHYLRDHVNYCWPKYNDLYRSYRLNLKDQLKADYVERFIDNVVEAHRPNKEDRKYYYDKDQVYRFMLNIGTIKGKESAKVTLKTIRQFAHEAREPEGKYLSKYLDERKGVMVRPLEETIEKYYQLYIVDSCKYYVVELEHIIKPIIYDYNLLYRKDRDQVDRDLFAAMSYFKLCQILLDETKNSLLSEMIKISKKDDEDEIPNVVRKPIKEQIEEDKEKFKDTLLDDKKYNSQAFMVNLRHNINNLNRKRGAKAPNVDKNASEKAEYTDIYDNIDYPSEDDD